jgi:hypothetical protein
MADAAAGRSIGEGLMKDWTGIIVNAILLGFVAWGAHAYGFSEGVQSVPPPAHPDFYSTACFWLGQETMGLDKKPDTLALIERVKGQCVKK